MTDGTLTEISGTTTPDSVLADSLSYEIDFHAELWSPDLKAMLLDISSDLTTAGSTVSYDGNREVRHTATLRFGRDYSYDETEPNRPDWGRNRLKLLCSLTNAKTGKREVYSLGFYIVETTSKVLDSDDNTVTASCYDLTTQLDAPIGYSYVVEDGTPVFDAIRTVMEDQGQWGLYEPKDETVDDPITLDYFLSPSDSNIVKGRVWGLGEESTWRRVLKELAAEGGYRNPWIDREGTLVIDGQYGTAPTVSLPHGDFSVFGEGSRVTTDVFEAPNQWIGIAVLGGEEGVYGLVSSLQDIELEKGAHSFEGRGKRVVRRVYQLDVTEEEGDVSTRTAAFKRQFTRLVNDDREVTRRVDFVCAPMPLFWHSEIVDLTNHGVDGKWRVTAWRLPLDGTDMTVQAQHIVEEA